MSDLGNIAKGRWSSLLPALGIDARFLTGKHGPCPMCEGRDRFRFDDKEGRGTWFCSHCGAGDGVKLVQVFGGLSFLEAKARIEPLIGAAPVVERKAVDVADVRRRAREIWQSGRPIDQHPATRAWWLNRVGFIPNCPDLRAVDDCWHDVERRRFPAMVAFVRGPDGSFVNLHRTYLTIQGEKAPVEKPRLLMKLSLPKGSAVRLCGHTDTLGIGEGIETSSAAMTLHAVPAWAALNADNLAAFNPPEGVARLLVFGDNDPKFSGQVAAYSLGRRQAANNLETEVMIPPTPGQDWRDVLQSLRREQAA